MKFRLSFLFLPYAYLLNIFTPFHLFLFFMFSGISLQCLHVYRKHVFEYLRIIKFSDIEYHPARIQKQPFFLNDVSLLCTSKICSIVLSDTCKLIVMSMFYVGVLFGLGCTWYPWEDVCKVLFPGVFFLGCFIWCSTFEVFSYLVVGMKQFEI